SNKLVAFSNKTDEDSVKRLELLLFKRAAIVKTASQKTAVLQQILNCVGTVEHCLMYCHSTEQMLAANEVLHSRNISYHRFTGDEGTTPLPEYGGLSEREVILKGLDDGTYQALVAMKCLDEGVDVPSAGLGIILASSGSPREYIQRRGRLLRRSPGKKKAVIYDLVVVPDPALMTDDRLRKIEHDILKKELSRVGEFGSSADNALDVHTWILGLLSRMN
ncbi:MAG: helicase-related protein, partial [Actinomycetota bacterium]|nr:helicase-related protein [Actinomycetota bacterium]